MATAVMHLPSLLEERVLSRAPSMCSSRSYQSAGSRSAASIQFSVRSAASGLSLKCAQCTLMGIRICADCSAKKTPLGSRRPLISSQTPSSRAKEVDEDSPEAIEMLRCLREKKVDVQGIKELLAESKSAVNVHESSFGWSPILFAAHRGDVKLLTMLLESRADVNSKCLQGNTAMHIAARRGNANAVSLLQSRGVDMEAQNIQGWTPLMWSAIAGSPSIASALVDANASANTRDRGGRTACMWAARHGHADILRCLLSMGADLSLRDEDGLTIRHHAKHYVDMQKSVIAHSTAENEQSEALYWPTAQGSLDLERLLMQHASSGSGQSGDMLAPLQAVDEAILRSKQLLEAARRNDWEAAEEALRAGACASTRGGADSVSPLIWAAKHNAPVSAFSLVAAMADLEARDGLGWTALHHAVHAENAQMVAVLHYLGADFTAKSDEGVSVQELAALSDSGEMLQLLGPATPDWNVPNGRSGQTPLQLSAARGCLSAVKALLALKADASVKDDRGNSVLAIVAASGHVAVVRALVEPVEPLTLMWKEQELNKMLETLPWVDSDADAPYGHDRHGCPNSNSSVCSGSNASFNSYSGISAQNNKLGTRLAGHMLQARSRPLNTIKEADSEACSTRSSPRAERPKSAGSQKSVAPSQVSTLSRAASVAKSTRSQASVQSLAKSACSRVSAQSVARSAKSHASLHSKAGSRASGFSRTSGMSRASRASAGGRSRAGRLGSMPSTIYSMAETAIGRSPLSLMNASCKGCSDECLPPALTAASAVSEADAVGLTPLFLAARARQPDVVMLLLELKAAPDVADLQGNTPLMLAAAVGDQGMVKCLLGAGASVNSVTTNGLHARDLARNAEIREILQSAIDRTAVAKQMRMSKSCSLPRLVKATPKTSAKAAATASSKPSLCRVRLDGLPARAPADQIQDQVRETLRCCHVASPLDMDVVVDPITLRSRGHVFLDYATAEQADAACVRLKANVEDISVSIEGRAA